MRQELDEKLCSAFPLLYEDRHAPMSETCMCWGFPGDGWFDILWELSGSLETLISLAEQPDQCTCGHNISLHQMRPCTGALTRWKPTGGVGTKEDPLHHQEYAVACPCEDFRADTLRASQVKQKFGTLRFYMAGGTPGGREAAHALIRSAEGKSAVTCEDCGNPGGNCGVGWRKNWRMTLCQGCEEARNKDTEA